MITVRAITPRRLPMARNTQELLERQLGRLHFAGDVINDLADYPPQQPTVSGYRRTGDLGRGWRLGSNGRVQRRGADLIVEVINRQRHAVHVQGPRPGTRGRRQTDEMFRRRWPNVTAVSRRRWREHREIIVRILAQQDPRLQRPAP